MSCVTSRSFFSAPIQYTAGYSIYNHQNTGSLSTKYISLLKVAKYSVYTVGLIALYDLTSLSGHLQSAPLNAVSSITSAASFCQCYGTASRRLAGTRGGVHACPSPHFLDADAAGCGNGQHRIQRSFASEAAAVFPAADGLPDSGLGSSPTDPPFRPNRSPNNKGPNERDPTCLAQQRTSCARRRLCKGTSTPDR